MDRIWNVKCLDTLGEVLRYGLVHLAEDDIDDIAWLRTYTYMVFIVTM